MFHSTVTTVTECPGERPFSPLVERTELVTTEEVLSLPGHTLDWTGLSTLDDRYPTLPARQGNNRPARGDKDIQTNNKLNKYFNLSLCKYEDLLFLYKLY